MNSFSIGLSFLSSDTQKGTGRKELYSAEARRILALLDGNPLKDNALSLEGNGRPYFSDRHADFNISHSGNIAAVSYISGLEQRTGCDIELVRSKVNARGIAELYFSPFEIDYVFASIGKTRDIDNTGSSIGESEVRFFTIWTLKECFLKLRGLSVFNMRDTPSFISRQGLFTFDTKVFSPVAFYVYELRGENETYLLSAAIEGNGGGPPEIRWFSHTRLPERSVVEIKAALNPTDTVSPKR